MATLIWGAQMRENKREGGAKAMFRGLLLKVAALVALWGGSAAAALNTTDYFYLKNVGTGKLLGAGQDWGTRACVLPHGQRMKFEGARVDDSTYRYAIHTQVGESATKDYLNNSGSSAFCDQGTKLTCVVTAVGGEDNIYTIHAEGEGYLTADEVKETVDFKDVSGDAPLAQWEILSEEQMRATLEHSSARHPADATFLIPDPNFGRQNRDFSQWNIDTTTVAAKAPGTNGESADQGRNLVLKFKQTDTSVRSVSKTLNLPVGFYKLAFQTFFVKKNTGATAGKVTVGDVSLSIPSANNMVDLDVCKAFTEGKYKKELTFYNNGGSTTSLKIETGKYNQSMFVDNFELTCLGQQGRTVTIPRLTSQLTCTAENVSEPGLLKKTVNADGSTSLLVPDESRVRVTFSTKSTSYAIANGSRREVVATEDVTIDVPEVRSVPSEEKYFVFDTATGTIEKYTGTAVTKVTVPETIGGVPVRAIGGFAFTNCTAMTSISLPPTLERIGEYAFSGCSRLTSVDFGANPVLDDIGEFAFRKTGLRSIVIPDSVTYVQADAFEACSSLTSAVVGSGVRRLASKAFSGCTQLQSVTIKDANCAIDSGVFNSCTGLQNLVMPEGVKCISQSAFNGCTNTKLTFDVIPRNVEVLADYSLNGKTAFDWNKYPNLKILSRSYVSFSDGSDDYAVQVRPVRGGEILYAAELLELSVPDYDGPDEVYFSVTTDTNYHFFRSFDSTIDPYGGRATVSAFPYLAFRAITSGASESKTIVAYVRQADNSLREIGKTTVTVKRQDLSHATSKIRTLMFAGEAMGLGEVLSRATVMHVMCNVVNFTDIVSEDGDIVAVAGADANALLTAQSAGETKIDYVASSQEVDADGTEHACAFHGYQQKVFASLEVVVLDEKPEIQVDIDRIAVTNPREDYRYEVGGRAGERENGQVVFKGLEPGGSYYVVMIGPGGEQASFEVDTPWKSEHAPIPADVTDDKAIGIEVPYEWVEQNFGKGIDDATARTLLEQKKPNGFSKAQEFVLGSIGDAEPFRLIPGHEAPGQFKLSVSKYLGRETSGVNVRYRLDRKTGGEAYVEGDLRESASFLLNYAEEVSEAKPLKHFKVNLVFVKGDKQEVIAEKTYGLLRVAPGMKTAIVPVPWQAVTNDISVADLLDARERAEGDELYVYDRDAKAYRVWRATDGAWSPLATYRLDETGRLTKSDAGLPDETRVPRGAGVWLKYAGAHETLYMTGFDGTNAVSPLAKGAWNLVANPTAGAFDLNRIAGSSEDVIVVPQPPEGGTAEAAPRRYTRVGGAWGYDREEIVRWIGTVPIKRTVRVEDATLPLGQGFWYVSGGEDSPAEIKWEVEE